MPWTKTTRREYERRGRRYASDLSDREWALVAPFLPPAKRIGRPRTTALRDVLDAIVYMASTGCQWALLPNDFPPPSTVQRYFYDWRDSGLLATINHHLVMAARDLEGRELRVPGPEPRAGAVDDADAVQDAPRDVVAAAPLLEVAPGLARAPRRAAPGSGARRRLSPAEAAVRAG